MVWSSVDAARPFCSCASSQISCGRLRIEHSTARSCEDDVEEAMSNMIFSLLRPPTRVSRERFLSPKSVHLAAVVAGSVSPRRGEMIIFNKNEQTAAVVAYSFAEICALR